MLAVGVANMMCGDRPGACTETTPVVSFDCIVAVSSGTAVSDSVAVSSGAAVSGSAAASSGAAVRSP